MHSWVFRNRARLAVVYGHTPPSRGVSAQVHPGDVLRTKAYVLLGPWGRRVG